MWLRNITAQKAFALASVFLASGVSAAAIPQNLVDPVSVAIADIPTTTQISKTTEANGKPTSVPVADVPNCRFCREDDEDEETTDELALPGIDGSESLESIPVITISSSGDSSDTPSKTTRQPATQVKRATATKTDDKYKKLHSALGKTPEVGKGYAIKISMSRLSTVLSISGSERNEVSGKSYPDHYLIAVGYVTERTEGNTVILKFDSGCYDIQLDDKTIEFTDRSDATWYSWTKASYEVLGKIKSGLTYEDIERDGKAIATEMNKKGYNLLTNNCRDFVMKLYKKIKA
ncbi:hypothetical protein BO94DRAFT_590978 [Aspergillus sclerotioniger CBS 115572]|uniref:Uncharacterized protein n=1 Tax=Aspergillus sclerotioniger CBS 115572 TaxID=1450535 RepID=A0A317V4E0_9EURO|nr:hypothetical protein BO94DRAFT_590978 [Aspergillus sclerotioniger CBS 115572]PWY67070.1 hypothetical protein BO94DRAFT_590978 [Aspergillus sclerotioniger CBS 115572]